jgi:hypothetical protein
MLHRVEKTVGMVYPVSVGATSPTSPQLLVLIRVIVTFNPGYHAILDVYPERTTPTAVKCGGTQNNLLVTCLASLFWTHSDLLSNSRFNNLYRHANILVSKPVKVNSGSPSGSKTS